MAEVKTLRDMADIFSRLRSQLRTEPEEDENQLLYEQAMRNFNLCGAADKYCRTAGFENFFTGYPKSQELYKLAQNFFNKICNGELYTLCLIGAAGTGKTFTALSILKAWCMVQKPPLMIKRKVPDPECCKTNRKFGEGCPRGKCNNSRIEEVDAGIKDFNKGLYITSDNLCELYLSTDASQKTQYLNTELLILDEVGRVAQWNNKKECSVLFKVLEYRMSKDLPTILCSNLDYQLFKDLLGNALNSRIEQNGNYYLLDGIPDMRSKQQQEILSTFLQHRY